MAQRKRVNVATLRYVPNKLLREEYALPMVQRGKDAAMRGCTNGVINVGVSHGATKKGCNHEGYPNQAKKGHKQGEQP